MIVKVRRSSEFLATNFALQNFARLMHSHVRHVFHFLIERFIANGTFEIFVRFYVRIITGRCVHFAAAHGTLKGLFARMQPLMNSQIIRLTKTFSAHITTENKRYDYINKYKYIKNYTNYRKGRSPVCTF